MCFAKRTVVRGNFNLVALKAFHEIVKLLVNWCKFVLFFHWSRRRVTGKIFSLSILASANIIPFRSCFSLQSFNMKSRERVVVKQEEKYASIPWLCKNSIVDKSRQPTGILRWARLAMIFADLSFWFAIWMDTGKKLTLSDMECLFSSNRYQPFPITQVSSCTLYNLSRSI
mgnify:CR=1 FL=1